MTFAALRADDGRRHANLKGRFGKRCERFRVRGSDDPFFIDPDPTNEPSRKSVPAWLQMESVESHDRRMRP